jgi:hypothetical protein
MYSFAESISDRLLAWQYRTAGSGHLSRRQYLRIVDRWVSEIGLDPAL